MLTEFFTVGIVMLLCAMLPGPDFALVTKNTVLHSRRAGIYTSIGITIAILVHVTYCICGLAIVVSQSIYFFNLIKWVGAFYLIYLGIKSFQTSPQPEIKTDNPVRKHIPMKDSTALRQGFFCNLLNPKATLFFLALFTAIIKPGTPLGIELLFALELIIITLVWFTCLSLLLSHKSVVRVLNHIEKYIAKILGVCLIGFGVALAFVRR